jgi:hypothetical protein
LPNGEKEDFQEIKVPICPKFRWHADKILSLSIVLFGSHH